MTAHLEGNNENFQLGKLIAKVVTAFRILGLTMVGSQLEHNSLQM